MTDKLIEELKKVGEAAEKAKRSLAALALEVPAPVWDDHAALIGPFLNLPFRAVREELERLRERLAAFVHAGAEEALQLQQARAQLAQIRSLLPEAVKRPPHPGPADPPEWEILREIAVLCPDPAGGER